MNPNSWWEVGIDLESMAFNNKERIMKRDEKTDDDLGKYSLQIKTSKNKTPLMNNCLH